MAKKTATKKTPAKKVPSASRTTAPPPEPSGFYKTGEEIYETAAAEQAEAAERSRLRSLGVGGKMPREFFISKKGDLSVDVILLDHAITQPTVINGVEYSGPIGVHQHMGPNFSLWMCGKDCGFICPSCKTKHSQYVTKMSILDLNPWTTKDGRTISATKSIISLVKLDDWKKVEKVALKKFGTMRGLQLTLTRGPEDKSLRIGIPQLVDDEGESTITEEMFWTEEDLVATYGHEARKSDDGGIVWAPENSDILPFPYREIYKPPTEKELLAISNTGPVAGSDGDYEQEFTETEETAAADTRPTRTAPAADNRPEPPAPAKKAAKKKVAAKAPQPEPQTCAELGGEADKGSTLAEDTLTKKCREAGIDENDYTTWAEVGEALDLAADEIPMGGAEAESWEATGLAADADDVDAQADLTEACAKAELDVNDYETWTLAAAALDAAGYVEGDPEPEGGEEAPTPFD